MLGEQAWGVTTAGSRASTMDGEADPPRLVVVADDVEERAHYRSMLQRLGWHLDIAPSPRWVEREMERADIILVDALTAEDEALAAIRALRERGGDAAVIVLTDDPAPDHRPPALRAGASMVLPRPVGMADLLRRLRDIARWQRDPATASIDLRDERTVELSNDEVGVVRNATPS